MFNSNAGSVGGRDRKGGGFEVIFAPSVRLRQLHSLCGKKDNSILANIAYISKSNLNKEMYKLVVTQLYQRMVVWPSGLRRGPSFR